MTRLMCIASLSALGVVLLCMTVHAAPPPTDDASGARTPAHGTHARNPAARVEGLSRFIPERERAINELMEIVRSDKGGERALAVEMLGQYRAAEAAELLVEHIECPPVPFASFPDPFFHYPAAKALMRIGEPGIQAILATGLNHPASDKKLKIFAYVLWHYYRPMNEQEVGLYRLERWLKRAEQLRIESGRRYGTSGASQREKNLIRLIELYKTIRPDDPHDHPRQDPATTRLKSQP
jgi:hypothetical protein